MDSDNYKLTIIKLLDKIYYDSNINLNNNITDIKILPDVSSKKSSKKSNKKTSNKSSKKTSNNAINKPIISDNINDILEKNKLYTKISDKINTIRALVDIDINLFIENSNDTNTTTNQIKSTDILKILEYDKIKNNETLSNILLHYKTLSKKLGHIVYDAYRRSDFNILLSNIPNNAIPISKLNNINNIHNTNTSTSTSTENAVDNNINDNINNDIYNDIVDSHVIFDTLEHYSGIDTISKVIKVSPSAYLAKFKLYNDSKKLCKLIDGKMIGSNIIRADLLDSAINEQSEENELCLKQSIDTFEIIDKESIESIEVSKTEEIIKNNTEEIVTKEVKNEEVTSEVKTEEIVTKEVTKEVTEEVKTEEVKTEVKDSNPRVDIFDSIERELNPTVTHDNLLIVDIAQGIYNKICSFFRRN